MVARVLAGEADAFEELYLAHAQAVAGVVRATFSDREATEELTQEVFARALERLPSLREPERFRPWLLSIARHVAIDRRRVRTRVTALHAETADRVPDDEPGPGAYAELTELSDLVRGCVAGLSSRDATALSLATQFGFSPAELGTALGVSPGAAKVTLHRARKRLRQALCRQLLGRGPDAGCDRFRDLYDRGSWREAVQHVEDCQQCRAGQEVAEDRSSTMGARSAHG